ncbi:MAG TPA: hypothetical protein VFI91_12715 [Longimicrobiaceae bacterium]|nr:hypothetical protein [Longimicrobiaceae bacterium]
MVCGSCRAWNLAPLEERWEAIEEAERLFRRATIGSSTDNVALGKLPEGLEMVRVGRVQRPELAFWRYSDRLLSRWRKHRRGTWIYVGGGAVIASAFGSVLWLSVVAGTAAIQLRQARRLFMRTQSDDLVRLTHGRSARLERSDGNDGWRLTIPRFRSEPLHLHGGEALRALRGLLPYLNPAGGDPRLIRTAS